MSILSIPTSMRHTCGSCGEAWFGSVDYCPYCGRASAGPPVPMAAGPRLAPEIAPVAAHVFATAPDSERAEDADAIADLAEAHALRVSVHRDLPDAADAARAWAAASDRRAVVIAGSVVLAGEALALAAAEEWKNGWSE